MAKKKTEEKFTPECEALLGKARKDREITVLMRTEVDELAKEQAEVVAEILDRERMATRRSHLLSYARDALGDGQEFCEKYKENREKAHAKVCSAAPKAVSLWLADAVAVSGTKEEIQDLAGHDDVVSVEVNPTFEIPEVLQTPLEDAPQTVDGSAWGLAAATAPETWAGFGLGDGILVGHLDTGVDDTHPALAGKVAAFEEFDALGNPLGSAVHDSGSHGTHTAGTICGRTFNGVNIGMAPDARLASALVLPGGGGTFAQIIAGMQWAIGENVNVINMSLGALGYTTLWNIPILIATISGVLVVASIGNSGQGTSGGPGNDILALGVGATHYEDVPAGFSSGNTLVGVPWLFFTLTYIKPDVSAPGVDVLSSVPGPGLAAFSGTSMAAPHVAGAAALLQSTESALQSDPLAVRSLLLGAGREDLGEAGRDQRFGFGRLDTVSAAEAAVSLFS